MTKKGSEIGPAFADEERAYESGGNVGLLRSGLSLMQIENDTIRSIAIAKPRDEQKIFDDAMAELDRAPQEAARNFYVIPYKKHTGQGNCRRRSDDDCPAENVEGPSVKAARNLVRRWGNCSVSAGRIIGDDEMTISIEAVFIDMETGFRKGKVYSVSKWATKFGGGAYKLNDVKIAQAVAIGASKAERNAILESLPSSLVSPYYDRSRELASQVVMGDVKPRSEEEWAKAAGAKVLAHYTKIGLSAKLLEAHLGHPLSQITKQEFSDLVGIYNAIRDESAQIEEVFGAAMRKIDPTRGEAGSEEAASTEGETDEAEGSANLKSSSTVRGAKRKR